MHTPNTPKRNTGKLEAAGHTAPGVKERATDACDELAFSFYTVHDPAQGMAPPTVGRSSHLKEPHGDNAQMPLGRVVLTQADS